MSSRGEVGARRRLLPGVPGVVDPERLRVDGSIVGWVLTLCPGAGEGGGSFRYADPVRPERVPGALAADPERSAHEAARRARSTLRRYCAANRLNRLGTLTYAGAGNHDPRLLREHVRAFFKQVRVQVDGPLPYAWVPEWHKTDHGLHVHFAVGRYVARSLIESAWPHGFVHIKLIGDLPVGSGALAEGRKAGGYLAKYVGKSFEDGRRVPGLHRYDVAKGFQPERVHLRAATVEGVLEAASEVMGGSPEVVWHSSDAEGWEGPPAVWASWAG